MKKDKKKTLLPNFLCHSIFVVVRCFFFVYPLIQNVSISFYLAIGVKVKSCLVKKASKRYKNLLAFTQLTIVTAIFEI